MIISFFEEFPTKKNLAKLALVDFPTKLYLAAPSFAEFETLRKTIKNKHIKEFIYWPVLSRKEGYWISPFSQRSALKRIFTQLQRKKVSVMLDLELPTRQNPFLYITQLFHFWRNKRLIRRFIENHKGEVYTAEYYPMGAFSERILKAFGLHYHSAKINVIKMAYHSLHNFNEEFLRTEIRRGRQERGDNFLLAYGTIYAGIHGNEPLLAAAQLKKDLQIAREEKISEVVVFRLGGFTKQYKKVLGK